MSDKTGNQTSDLPDAHGGRLEENPGTGLLNAKEEDETDDMNSHQTEIHWSLPADEDNADMVKVEITEDLSVRHQLGAPVEENSDRISPGGMDVTLSEASAIEHGGEPYVCDHMKTEEDEVPINTATGDVKAEVTLYTEQTNYLEALKQEISDNISTGDVKTEVTLDAEQTNDLYVKSQQEAVKQKISDNISTGSIANLNNPSPGQIHIGNSCSQGGEFFTKKSNLIKHQKIHTEERFSCTECEKCFMWKSQLVTHHKIHTGEKTFSCSLCGKFIRNVIQEKGHFLVLNVGNVSC
ncbi:gastrula zinc finger protein XlCGF57.1-like [Bombina bombina]|uniref:gastrula zinc finger protein XlCGF57.1-like n=1 Tax=Bombina bombina TaxID=8345 RepID=UPI00235AC3BB|nr:gastrula zinc finger protein XlCGF57.1-like [Bombina bombina]